jgi:aspartate-semialdehyde dehydrogenase
MKSISIVGATGAVGREILSILQTRAFPICSIRLFASPKSQNVELEFKGEKLRVEVLNEKALSSSDLTFFCAGSSISKEWIPKTSGFIIDSSSAFRSSVPLVIPEINAHTLIGHRIIASPNCAATLLLMPLAPLHHLFKVKRIVVATYQAASGAGAHWVRELENETRAYLENRPYTNKLPYPYAFNLFPHQSPLDISGYAEEELKILNETRKILEDQTIHLSATCIRVPILRAHSLTANVEFHSPFTLEAVRTILRKTPGVSLFETENLFPTPLDATGKDEILCGRLRIDPSQPNTLEFWAVGDQLKKGAALNAVQIGEKLLGI